MSAYPHGIPGIRTERTATPVRILKSPNGVMRYPSALVLDGAESRDTGNTGDLDVLRCGTLLGKITSSGKFAPTIIGVTGALHDTSAVTVTFGAGGVATAAIVTEITRRIGTSGSFVLVGPPTAAGTVAVETVAFSAIASSTTITITATAADFAAGSLICAADGSYLPLGVLGAEYGQKVTDEDASDIDVPLGDLLIGGLLDSSAIPFWSSMDASVKAWVVTQLNTYGRFWFDHHFGA